MTPWLVLFEDARWADLAPLTDVLPVPALAFGDSHLARRWLRVVPAPRLLAVEARALPLAAWREAPGLEGARPADRDETWIVNAAALPGPWFPAALTGPGTALWTAGDRVIGARAPFGVVAPGLGSGAGFEAFLRGLELPSLGVEARLIRWPWEIVEWSPEALATDLEGARPEQAGAVDRLAAIYEPGRVSVAPGARVDAYAVLDARPGPIRIGPRARVAAHTVISGPCVVGEATELLGGAMGRSTIGPECRLAGEVDSSVWQGFANKRHHGFVGHSVVGEWVNLGALTTTSDLKNTYGQVRVRVGEREVETGYHKIGSFIGAHVKTGIGTLLPTGASLGTGSNLFGGGRFAPKRVPAFTWWDGDRAVEHRFDRFLETARIAMARRGRPMDPADERALAAVFEAAGRERSGAVASGGRLA